MRPLFLQDLSLYQPLLFEGAFRMGMSCSTKRKWLKRQVKSKLRLPIAHYQTAKNGLLAVDC